MAKRVTQVLAPDGTVWRPKPGTRVSAREFSEALDLILSTFREQSWNPWVVEDRAEELAAAEAILGQWTRAEPDFRPMTTAEINAWTDKLEEKAAARTEHRERERLTRVQDYDEQRHLARLRLLEREAQVRLCRADRAAVASGEWFPLMPESKRASDLARLDVQIVALQRDVDALRERVGDPETVVDEHGYLPADRRELMLVAFMRWREREVSRLRMAVAKASELLAVKGQAKAERAKLRRARETGQTQLEILLQIPPLGAGDMCSDCVRPLGWHGYAFKIGRDHPCVGPCPEWPEWADLIQRTRKLYLLAFADDATPAEPAPPPEPAPLAVIPSGLPIAEVVQLLTEIQSDHPNADVRRGRGNAWEIWPGKTEQ
ncbi:hypothetical protein [Allokutzneria albata]|uniref:Uncharacterized protein n=1 Tax=Allokutzneria albata TaxID=211114 RepID=A0A1G9Y964_ALLAB|nr:hypothetical protein [Allokutzneria albata]SDN05021.1 hypothetical protein SAMN04489726_4647 [Allokutzneria albata]